MALADREQLVRGRAAGEQAATTALGEESEAGTGLDGLADLVGHGHVDEGVHHGLHERQALERQLKHTSRTMNS